MSLSAQQLAGLQSLVIILLANNPFYRRKFEAAGVGPDVSRIEDLPFTTKQELVDDQAAHPPFGTNLTYPLERYTRFCQTSGTTGQPMRWLDTPESWSWMLANWARVFEAAGVTHEDRIFFAFSFGPFLGFWTAFESAGRIGCLCIPGGGMRSALRLHTIIETGATILCCTPTYAIRLAEVAAEEKIDLAQTKIRRLIFGGEPGGSVPGTRTYIEKLWNGARVFDHHGMTEIGPVTYGCPERPDLLHVIESAYIAEILDPATGEPLPPGARGELVLTGLGRTGSPLLRYRTGDLVEAAPAGRCVCGSDELALPGGILGRTDDMVVIRGVNVYPSAIDDIVRTCGGVAEYRVEVHTDHALPDLRIQVEPLANEQGVGPRLEAALNNALGLRVPVTVVFPGGLPRFEMKAKRWVRS